MINVLQVSKAYKAGGASIAAARLNIALRRHGVNSQYLTLKNSTADQGVITLDTKLHYLWGNAARVLDRVPGMFCRTEHSKLSSAWLPGPIAATINKIAPDVVNLHWVNDGFLSVAAIPKIKAPKVWTLHDMWAFAGGEHYVGEDERYKQGYLKNNRGPDETGLDINRWIWQRKKKLWQMMGDLVIVTPSQWLAKCVKESVVFKNHPVEVIPNGIDHQVFKAIDKQTARSIFNLPADKKLLLFGASNATSDKRKGFHLLKAAMAELESQGYRDDFEIVVFGADKNEAISLKTKINYLGTLRDETSLAIIYSAVDVFIAPSLQDNLPNTILESMACGTPVISFEIGGMPDMIAHKKNGYLARPFLSEDLANGIQWVLEDESRWSDLSKNARATIVNNFTLAHQAGRYESLYKSMCSQHL
jgi:glycosyltransferase involved in cell wall biosynthesis